MDIRFTVEACTACTLLGTPLSLMDHWEIYANGVLVGFTPVWDGRSREQALSEAIASLQVP